MEKHTPAELQEIKIILMEISASRHDKPGDTDLNKNSNANRKWTTGKCKIIRTYERKLSHT